ncbi:MAG: type II toxin-antitoxin system VapC family toxin [Anaerolineales bacterium]|nr:type II toxin-antitoxin system VapC family toxin [Anaerolineales bacterium]MCX7607883.1 type II toxin-antitoxin system VapC family toxin [Anaerolineales bacterium]
MIVDASVLLSALFPDEAQLQAQELLRRHVAGQEHLRAPDLLLHEVNHALWRAERCGKVSEAQVGQMLAALKRLELELWPLDWEEILPLARQANCSAYDAAYLALARRKGEPLITADERLYNTVAGQFPWVRQLGSEG